MNNTPILSKREYIQNCINTLDNTKSGDLFAKLYCLFRNTFFHVYNTDKLICSTAHGIDFFHNMLAVIEGRLVWKEMDGDKESEYSKNFNKLAKNP